MAFNYKEAWRKAEAVQFSRTTVTDDGRKFPQFVKDGFGNIFRFKSATAFVVYQSVEDEFCFKLFTPNMRVRNLGRELFNTVPVGKFGKTS